MVPDDDRTRRRRARSALTDRQRHVLDLLSAGKTNGEIATDLGVSLDGAKYHVREVCDRLGVDSREEAAEWWRQQQGMRARFAVVRHRLERMPGLVRWGLAGGAALGAVAVAVFAFWPQDEDRAGLDPGVWVALPVPRETERRGEWLVQLRLVNAKTSEERDVGEPASWYWLSLAPDGERLYAMEVTEEAPGRVLHLFDPSTNEAIVALPWERKYAPDTAIWSPDGTRLSVVTHDWAGVMTSDGVLHGGPFRPEPEVGSGTGRCSWAADSSRFMCVAGNNGERMVIVDHAGALIAFLEGDALAPRPLDTLRRRTTNIKWLSSGEIEMYATTIENDTSPPRSWRSVGELDATAGTLTWGPTQELSEQEATILFAEQIARQREVFEGHGVPGGSPWGGIRDSWDQEFAGTFVGDASASGEPSPPSSDITFVAFVDGERFAYPLGHMLRPITSYLFLSWDMVRVE